jgi:excisionase family DNA binding protein
MKVTYDKKADALSLVFGDARISRDAKLAENVFAGYDREGHLVEIQVLEASKRQDAWFTLEAVAVTIGKSKRTLLRWIDDKKINPRKVGREYRFTPAQMQLLVHQQTDTPSPARRTAKRRR